MTPALAAPVPGPEGPPPEPGVDPAAPLLATAATARGAVDPAAAPLTATSGGTPVPGASSARTLLPDAVRGFGTVVDAAARGGAWAAATPCSPWDVRGVVAHVAAQHRRVPSVLGLGAPPAARASPDGLGDDPRSAWRSVAAASTAAWAVAAADATVVLRGQDAPASDLAERLLLDLVVHTWDVRRALVVAGVPVGGDDDGACLDHSLAWARAHAALLAGSGHFGDPRPTDSPDPLDVLLALTGRWP